MLDSRLLNSSQSFRQSFLVSFQRNLDLKQSTNVCLVSNFFISRADLYVYAFEHLFLVNTINHHSVYTVQFSLFILYSMFLFHFFSLSFFCICPLTCSVDECISNGEKMNGTTAHYMVEQNARNHDEYIRTHSSSSSFAFCF